MTKDKSTEIEQQSDAQNEAEVAQNEAQEQVQQDQQDLEVLCKRIQADFDNYRKRTEQEKQLIRKTAAENLVRDLLPVVDALHLSLQHVNSEDTNSIKQTLLGVEYISKQFMDTLESHGVKMYNDINVPFDPYVHEAVEKREGTKDITEVVEVRSPGYSLGDKILRHAKVVVESNDKNK